MQNMEEKSDLLEDEDIGKILTTEVAKILHVSPQFVRIAMQRGILPIGTALKMSSVYTYQIEEKKLEAYIGKDVRKELKRIRGNK